MKKLLATTAVLGFMASAASAATVVDLTTGGDVTSLGTLGSFSSGYVSGDIDPWRWGWSTDYLTQTSEGLGVTGWGDTSSQLDGIYDESITFYFDKAVRLMNVSFGNFSGWDDADVYINGIKVANDSSSNPFAFGGVIASSFTIAADGWFDNFRVKDFKVAAVPVPAAGLLLLGGLAGLGLVGRRRNKSA